MFNWKKEEIAQNAIYLDKEMGGKGRQFKSRFLVPGLVKYDYGVCLLTKENADKFIQDFVGCPVIINHQDVTDENAKEISVGNIFSVWFDEKDGYYWCNGIITDKDAIKLIDKGYSVSCQYTITEYSDNNSGALHNGNPYDKIIENGRPEHLAIVNNPRYEGAIIAVNAIMAQNEDQWITIKPNGEDAKGRHLLIKDGESVHEALQRTYGIDGAKGQQKLFDTKGDRKTKEDFKREREEKQKKSDEIDKRRQEEKSKKEAEKQANISKMKDDAKKLDYDEFFEKYKDKFEEYGYNKYFGGLDVWKEAHPDLDYFDIAAETYKDKKDDSDIWGKEIKEEEKKYTWKDKEYTLKELVEEGFTPTGYTSTLDGSKPQQYLTKTDGKKEYRLPVSDDDLKKISEYQKEIESDKLQKAKEQSKDLTEYVKWQYNQDIEPHITRKVKDKIVVDWNNMSRETRSALKQLANDDKIILDMYTGWEMGIQIKDKKIIENLNKHRKDNKASNSFINEFKDTLYEVLAEGIANRLGELIASNEDRWITIHPHGDESDDYRRLKIKDGETVEEAMHRQGYYNKRKAADDKQKKLVEEKIKELTEKAKKVGGENTVLGKKYLRQIEELKKGNIGVKDDETNLKQETKENGLLPSYANDFFNKKEKMEAARDKWHKILAELQTKAKDDKKFIEFQKQLDEVYNKMQERRRYDYDFQQLINEKNKILDAKHEYEKEFYKEAYAAQDEYTKLSTTEDKKDIITKMSSDVKKQINKISSQNDNLVKQINKIDTSRFAELKKEDEEIKKQQSELSDRSLKLDWLDPERKEIRNKFEQLAKRRGEIKQEKRELEVKTAQEVSKILQVKNGVNLNTHCSSKMQPITDKLKKCLDGVIPESNFNNAEMTVRAHSGRAFHSGSTINISSNEDIGTAIHETMHHLEEHSEHVLMNSLAFAASRTEGEKQASLKRLTGLSYKSSEVCKKDNFFNPYCGKLYDVFGGRDKKFVNSYASEIMSMGVQELFTNPKEFAKNDREYFDFVVANLQGRLWN